MFPLVPCTGPFAVTYSRLDIGIKVDIKSRRKKERYVPFNRLCLVVVGFKKVSYKHLYSGMFMIHMHTVCLLKLFSLGMCNIDSVYFWRTQLN